jgi:hypothetical protein
VLISNCTDCPLFGKFAADACCGVGIAKIVGCSRNKKIRITKDSTRSCICAFSNLKTSVPRLEDNFVIFSDHWDPIYKQSSKQIFGTSGTIQIHSSSCWLDEANFAGVIRNYRDEEIDKRQAAAAM